MDKRIVSIGLLSLVNVLGFSILIPVLPFVVEKFGAGNITYGILIATYPFFQFLAAPALGTLSDHYGRRPLLIISQTGTLLSWIIFAISYFVPTIPIGPIALPILILIVSRITDGITGGNFSVANAYISDITTRDQRTKIFGILGATVGVGLIIGPIVGGFLMSTEMGYFGIALFSFFLSLITLVLMYRFLPESLSRNEQEEKLEFHILREINIIGKINHFKRPNIRKLFFIRAFFALSFSSYTSTIVLFMRDGFNLTPGKIGLLFLVLGSFFIFNQAVATPFFAKRFGDLQTFYIGQFLMMAGFILVSLAPSLWLFLPAAYIANLGASSSFPTFKSVITGLVDEKRQGAVTGVDESVLAGASAIAPLMASIIYNFTGQYAYAFFAAILVIPFVVIYLRTGSLFIKHR
ncbi:MAG: MFS transporter [Candidatus Roizmanbacteria bacterium]|nr:MFS transporter [Candidatus Roizmanbacteria bacterium]